MASAKGLLLAALSFVTRAARITQARDLGHGVRVLLLEGPDLGTASWTAGDKIELLLPSKDVRTYTPSRFGSGMELVTFDHGDAPGAVWSRRAKVGASQNRMAVTVSNLATSHENLSAANSRIRDVDVAQETASLTKSQILSQAGLAVLAQANQLPQSVLRLLG